MTSDTQNNKLAIDYLLMANLNLLDRGEEGPAGNGRLRISITLLRLSRRRSCRWGFRSTGTTGSQARRMWIR